MLQIIADAANVTLGLESVSWFLLAVFTMTVGMIWFFSVAMAWYLKTTKAKKEE